MLIFAVLKQKIAMYLFLHGNLNFDDSLLASFKAIFQAKKPFSNELSLIPKNFIEELTCAASIIMQKKENQKK